MRRVVVFNHLSQVASRRVLPRFRAADCGTDHECGCDSCLAANRDRIPLNFRDQYDAPTLSKEDAGYVEPSPIWKHCGMCTMFLQMRHLGAARHGCSLVAGAINRGGVCRKFELKPGAQDEDVRSKALRILEGSPSGTTQYRFEQMGVPESVLRSLVREGKARSRVLRFDNPAGVAVTQYFPA